MQRLISAVLLVIASASLSMADDIYRDILLEGSDMICSALGIAPLRMDASVESNLEVRIWTDHGIAYPNQLIRLSASKGHPKGEIFHWWPQKLPPPPCTQLWKNGAVNVCQQQDAPGTDWRAILEKFISLQILSLPTQSTRPNVRDGSGFLIEVRQGHDYRNTAYIVSGFNTSQADYVAKEIWTTVAQLIHPL